MRINKKTSYFIFQVLFFTLSTFVLHFALFDFIGGYRAGNYENRDHLESTFLNWLPVLIFDLFVGLIIGLFISFCSVLLSKKPADLKIPVIATDIFWLLFCFIWYSNNKGGINVEAVGHLISPFIVGFVGLILALINLVFFLLLFKNNEPKSLDSPKNYDN
jgi:hypothetical protein